MLLENSIRRSKGQAMPSVIQPEKLYERIRLHEQAEKPKCPAHKKDTGMEA